MDNLPMLIGLPQGDKQAGFIVFLAFFSSVAWALL